MRTQLLTRVGFKPLSAKGDPGTVICKGGSGYAQSSVLLSQLPQLQGLLDLAHMLRMRTVYAL